jgi:hypothetical protein
MLPFRVPLDRHHLSSRKKKTERKINCREKKKEKRRERLINVDNEMPQGDDE